jgi:hypothetical protein
MELFSIQPQVWRIVVAYRATRGDRPSIKSLNVEEREAIFQASYDWSVAQMMLKPI